MPGVQIETSELRDLQKRLRRFDDKTIRTSLTGTSRDVAKFLRGVAEKAARPDVRRGIGHKANTKGPFLTLQPKPPYALGVLLGAKGRFGWYGAGRYRGSRARQFRPWVGNSITITTPYDIGPAVEGKLDEAVDMYADGIEDVVAKAFR